MSKSERIVALIAMVVLANSGIARDGNYRFWVGSRHPEFDVSKVVRMSGKVTRTEWEEYDDTTIDFEVPDSNGNAEPWTAIGSPPEELIELGWEIPISHRIDNNFSPGQPRRRASLLPGDRITVDGYLAKDEPRTLFFLKVTVSDPRKELFDPLYRFDLSGEIILKGKISRYHHVGVLSDPCYWIISFDVEGKIWTGEGTVSAHAVRDNVNLGEIRNRLLIVGYDILVRGYRARDGSDSIYVTDVAVIIQQ